MKWAYGITTTPERRYSYFPQTLKSLAEAGFNKPTVFVDGPQGDYSEFQLSIVRRSERIRAYGNWFLGLVELWFRNPRADRYAMFQDDMVTYKHLRDYLNTFTLQDNQYWNLYTFPQNEDLRPNDDPGWYASNQLGRGAVALVFNNRTVFAMLRSPILVAKPAAKQNPHRSIDGALAGCFHAMKVTEMVHYPTLVQHIGDCSSIGNGQHDKPTSWRGQEFDANDLRGVQV